MKGFVRPALVAFVVLSIQLTCGEKLKAVEDDFHPMVAFLCNKPAMYLEKTGWQRDEKTTCLNSTKDILKYCQKRFPTMGITNIVEAPHAITIENWCSFGHKHCKHHGSHTVIPYRCLVGPFQSDALLVPEHCVFDHVHNSQQCTKSMEWEKVAKSSCDKRSMVLQTYGILLPCEVDMFSGVEFVCCPKKIDVKPVEEKKIVAHHSVHDSEVEKEDVEDSDEDEEEDEEEEDDDVTEEEDSTEQQLPVQAAHPNEVDSEATKYNPIDNDVYLEYLKSSKLGHFMNEHQHFKAAEKKWEQRHHEKITKVLKEWDSARQRVREMKVKDPKGSEKLNKEITHRFQRTYEALEQEGIAERKQLNAVHQQRVQGSLNERKRHSLEKFMTTLQRNIPDAEEVWRALKQYVKAEEKDRIHAVKHFKHLLDSDPREAELIRHQTLDHINFITQRITQALDMLRRVPKFEKELRHRVEDLLKDYSDVDNSVNNLLVKAIKLAKQDEEKEQKEIEVKAEKVKVTEVKPIQVVDKSDKDKEEVDQVKPKLEAKEDAFKAPESKKNEMKEQAPYQKLDHVDVKQMEPEVEIKAVKGNQLDDEEAFDEETQEDEHDYVEVEKVDHVAMVKKDSLAVNEPDSYVHKSPMNSRAITATGPTLAIAIGSITVFVIIVAAVVVLRKRIQRAPHRNGFVEVDQTASPEERHVANMQINGYENPTYKYFEMNTNA